MKRQPRILAGTACLLLMASAPLGASPLYDIRAGLQLQSYDATMSGRPAIILAQAHEAGQAGDEPVPRKKKKQAAQEQEQQQQEQKPSEQSESTPKKNGKRQAAKEAAPVEEAAPAQADESTSPRKKRSAQEQAAPTPEKEVAPTQAEEQSRKKNRRQVTEEAAPVQQEEVHPAEEAPRKTRRPKVEEAAPEPDAGRVVTEQPVPGKNGRTTSEQPETTVETKPERGRRPTAEPLKPAGEQAQREKVLPPIAEEAPVLDSQKRQKREAVGDDGGDQSRARDRNARNNRQPVDSGPPPADDRAAQASARPAEIERVNDEKGVRRQRAPEARRQPPKGTEILREIGNRVIYQLGDQIGVESNDRPRMSRGAKDVYYEDLPRGRTRETIERPDGSRVVTIRNENGDVIRRSRITPDNHEYVLNYVDERNYDRMREWRDPGDDLPPLRLEIPENEYILNADAVRNQDAYYDFLDQPPVERVERLYSVDEVKRSARVRDMTRRVDLDTITFESGSAAVPQSEIERLDGVAGAMERLLKANPAETFLVEGHTDAVGSEVSNLALSDQRAEAVADALTEVFGIPPENLATQGYGEEYLKIDTDGAERENRRVAIRRITALVAPVASAD